MEIAKALSKEVKLLILDEPTAALNDDGLPAPARPDARPEGQGVSLIMISHKLNEIEQIADKITIIRDGKTIETLDARRDVDEDRIIRGMVGREMNSRFPERVTDIGEAFFEVRDIWVKHPQADDRYVCKGSNLVRPPRRGRRDRRPHGRWAHRARDEHLRSPYGALGVRHDHQGRRGDRAPQRGVGDQARHRLRQRGPQDPGTEPARRHQERHTSRASGARSPPAG